MKKLSLDIDGRKVEGFAVSAKGVLWAHVDGETFTVETEKRTRRGGKAAASSNPGEVVAPMPGKVIKILVKPGMKVAPHQIVIVMEAMKMEYTLKAASEGTVTDVKVNAGDQVTLGQLLARVDVT